MLKQATLVETDLEKVRYGLEVGLLWIQDNIEAGETSKKDMRDIRIAINILDMKTEE